MEVLCVNSNFSQEQLEFWSKYGVIHPLVDSIYNIREVINHTTGDVGVKLEEIINPKIPIKHPVLGVLEMEPSWNINRFRTLLGEEITKEELKLIAK